MWRIGIGLRRGDIRDDAMLMLAIVGEGSRRERVWVSGY